MFIKWNSKIKKYRVVYKYILDGSHKTTVKWFTQKQFDTLHSYVNLKKQMEA